MKKIVLGLMMILLWSSQGLSDEFAIIKDSLFGTKRIEITEYEWIVDDKAGKGKK